MQAVKFISSKPQNWVTPFPTIGEAIRSVANVLETKENNPKDYDRLARGEFFDHETIERLWDDALNIRDELKFGKIQDAINYERNNLLHQYISILKEYIPFGYSYRENTMRFLNRWIARIMHMDLESILENQDELLHKLIVSDNPVQVAFECKYYKIWTKFKKDLLLKENTQTADKLYRWMTGKKVPYMKNLFDVIELFYKYCKRHDEEADIDDVYKVFFCAKIIHNIAQQSPKILDELRRIDKCDIITLGEWYGERGTLSKVFYDFDRDYDDSTEQKNKERFDKFNALYMQIVNKLKKPHKPEDQETLDTQLKKLEKMTADMHDMHICWWNTQRLRAIWYVFSGELKLAKQCYEEIIDNVFYSGEGVSIDYKKIFEQPLVLAAFLGDRPFLKKVKHFGVVFGFFGRPCTNNFNFKYTQVNKKSRTEDPIVEDWEVSGWVNAFFEEFPKDGFFDSVEQPTEPVKLRDDNLPPLIRAVSDGDLQEVERLLKAGADVNKLYRGVSALLAAILKMDMTFEPIQEEQGNIKFFEMLSKYPHDKNTLNTLANNTHYSVLGCAVALGDLVVVKMVLEMMKDAKAEFDVKYGEKNVTPLYRAVNLLIMGDSSIPPDYWECAPENHFEVLRILGYNFAGVTTKQTRHNFLRAMSNPSCKESLEMEVQRMFDLHKKYHKKENMLPIIEVLLKYGCNPNEPHDLCDGGLRNYTPLMFAAQFDLIEAFELLLKYRGNIDKTCKCINERGGTDVMNCWHIAFKHKSNKVLKYMQKNCVDGKDNKKILLLSEI